MRTVVTFLEALLISGSVIYAIYGFTRLTAYCLLWMLRSLRWPGDAARYVQTSANGWPTRADHIAAIPHDLEGDRRIVGLAAEAPLAPSADVVTYVRRASQALFKYEQHAFCALSEMREAAARTRETIAKARALIVEADAIAENMCPGGWPKALVAVSQSQCSVAPVADPVPPVTPVGVTVSGPEPGPMSAISHQVAPSQSGSVASAAGA